MNLLKKYAKEIAKIREQPTKFSMADLIIEYTPKFSKLGVKVQTTYPSLKDVTLDGGKVIVKAYKDDSLVAECTASWIPCEPYKLLSTDTLGHVG